MADIADLAENQIEQHLKDSMRRTKAVQRLIPAGYCHYCGEAIHNGLFCPPVDDDGDGCSRDYDRQRKADQLARGY